MIERLLRLARTQVATTCELACHRVRTFWPAARPLERTAAAPLFREDHWARATAPIATAIAGFAQVEAFQSAAACRIVAADYALQHLIEELRTVMPIPADTAPLRAVLAAAAKQPAVAPDEALAA